MPNQFFHVNTYARKPSGAGGGKWSCQDIEDEENRVEENSPHVINPAQPIHFAGPVKIENLTASLETFLEDKKQEVNLKNGGKAYRKVREDAHVMLSSVFSWPEPIDNFNPEKAEKFFTDCVGFIEKKFGNVQCAIVHQDEAFPHIHIHSFSDNARKVHPGWQAKTEAKKQGKTPAEQSAAYKAAMVQMQDDFFLEVGQKHGLDRLGPKRQRLSRAEWLARKVELAKTADLHAQARGRLEATSNALADIQKTGRAVTRELENLNQELDKAKSELQKIDSKTASEKQKLESLQAQTRDLKRAENLARKAGGAVAVFRKVFYKVLGRETPEIQAMREKIKTLEQAEKALSYDSEKNKSRARESTKKIEFLQTKVRDLSGELMKEKRELEETIKEARAIISGLQTELAIERGEIESPNTPEPGTRRDRGMSL